MEWLCSIIDTLANSNNWSIDNILSAIPVFLVMVGSIFAYKQWTSSNKIKRSEFIFINQIIAKIRFDERTVDTIHMLEYDHE